VSGPSPAEALASQLASWWIWAAVTPLVVFVSRKRPVTGSGWRVSLGVHCAVGIAVVVGVVALQTVLAMGTESIAFSVDRYLSGVTGNLAFFLTANLITYGALAGAVQVWMLFERLRDQQVNAARLETELAQAQLESLRGTLQPHFLFNALHTVGGLVRAGDKDGAVQTITALSGLLRFSLEGVTRNEIPLHRELEALERYLEIEEVRFEDRMTVEREIAPDVLDALVPALILQPLVENAVRHGIGQNPEAGALVVRAYRDGQSLRLEVEDDGPGPGPSPVGGWSGGVGLTLTRDRLASLYDDQHDFALESPNGCGARVVVSIPFLEEGDRA
jgi:LytS/YehU family sensor histidine kinase